jgi:four helix bundle protein
LIADWRLRIADRSEIGDPKSKIDNSSSIDCGLRIADRGSIRDRQSQIRNPTGVTMDEEALKRRTKQFALRVIRLVDALPRSRTAEVVGRQLLRSATSVSANYRAACRARSKAEFIAKIGIVEEEADESAHWLEMIVEAGLLPDERVNALLTEANELTAIFVATGRTAKRRR